jgi:hypothetical protein
MLKGLVVRALRPDQPRVVFNTADERMARILRRMTVIKEDFRPTLWAQGAYLQLVALVLWNSYHAKSVSFTRHVVTCADGQDVALDEYATPKGCEDLPKTAPLALIIHTISGEQTRSHVDWCSKQAMISIAECNSAVRRFDAEQAYSITNYYVA